MSRLRARGLCDRGAPVCPAARVFRPAPAPLPPRRLPLRFRLRPALIPLLALALALPHPALAPAQEIRYVYDDLGRLVGVVDAQGNAAEYVYDAVGNLLEIRRFTADPTAAVAITLVKPTRGTIGTPVELLGKGFSAIPGANQVAFNGVAATVTEAAPGRLRTTVPPVATTGFITVTTPLGTATSPAPFTVIEQALAVVPPQVTLIVGKTFRFQATLRGTVTNAVTWRVNGVSGGAPSLGTITPEGLYTAPAVPPTDLLAIEAVLTADPTQVATAQVEVLPLSAGAIFTARLSVGPPQPVATANPLAGPILSVVPPLQPAAIANPLAAPGLSVVPPLQPAATANPLAATPVSVSSLPLITGVAPPSGARGTTVTVTLNGAGLSGATTLTVLRNGSADPLVTASNMIPNADGTSLTATLTIDAAAEVGGRILQVTAGGRSSTPLGTGTNAFAVN